jgi:hypothetical protein
MFIHDFFFEWNVLMSKPFQQRDFTTAMTVDSSEPCVHTHQLARILCSAGVEIRLFLCLVVWLRTAHVKWAKMNIEFTSDECTDIVLLHTDQNTRAAV